MLKPKNRKVWILPHCLSISQTVELVDFEAAEFNGGIIKNGKTLPSNLGRQTFGKPKRPNDTGCSIYFLPISNGHSSIPFHISTYVVKTKIGLRSDSFV